MTEHATLDIDKMRQTIIENTDSIQDLSGKNRELEEQNKKLQAELQELKEQKVTLEKEKAKLLPLEKYKEAVEDFMDTHYDGDEPYDHDDTLDTDIIKYYSDWHTNKVFMDKWVYDDVINSKEELNEYRIYKKVKGEMVSNGMDNSNVARNVRSIKKGINKLNS
jgi:chromosome segregation ATPase